MEKKLTPVGTILEWIDEKIDHFERFKASPEAELADMDYANCKINELNVVRKVVAAQLPEERLMILKSFNDGMGEGGNRIAKMHPNYPGSPDLMPTQYLNNTYRQK